MSDRSEALATHLRSLGALRFELPALLRFVLSGGGRSGTGRRERLALLARFYAITASVACAHKQSEMLRMVEALFALDPRTPGCVVEAGVYKGGSAAKLSLACALIGRDLVLFDSFEGIPENDEVMDAAEVIGARGAGPDRFVAGDYHGSRAEVEETLRRHGGVGRVTLVPGRFSDTMPPFDREVCFAFLDVDLALSTRTCLRHLGPRLADSGGELFSHDGHLPRVRELFEDERFFESIGLRQPRMEGLGERRLIRARRLRRAS